MKKTIIMCLMAMACLITVSAQNQKCPISGDYNNLQLGGDWGESSLFISADKKVGNNSHMSKRMSNGNIYMADVYFEKEKNYNIVYNKTTAADTYEFTVEYYVGKQLRTGKLQIKKSGDELILTGLDPATKKLPFHGKTYQKNQM